ncbi:hypothetical protein KL86CIT2_390083 [uncultured Citrobacter sp.]|uniref:Uncharacterized protein n=1 Tax=uncultured Citrobacter sp. TaxID=200446 RepID=A0A212IDV0_9ENTR|nr:hypothetical protein KL86CIT2_390083 [uncultured Citrobacter sp.]
MLAHNARIWALCTLPPLAFQLPEHYLNSKDVSSPASYRKALLNSNANCLTKCYQKQEKI